MTWGPVLALVVALAVPAASADELLAGGSVVVRSRALVRVIARPPAGRALALPGPENDPASGGASVTPDPLHTAFTRRGFSRTVRQGSSEVPRPR